MIDNAFEYERHWTEMYEELGLDAVREDVANSSTDHRAIGKALIKELEEKERHTATLKRDEGLRRLAVDTLDAQRNGNETQKHILWTLLATIAVTLLVAIFKNG